MIKFKLVWISVIVLCIVVIWISVIIGLTKTPESISRITAVGICAAEISKAYKMNHHLVFSDVISVCELAGSKSKKRFTVILDDNTVAGENVFGGIYWVDSLNSVLCVNFDEHNGYIISSDDKKSVSSWNDIANIMTQVENGKKAMLAWK